MSFRFHDRAGFSVLPWAPWETRLQTCTLLFNLYIILGDATILEPMTEDGIVTGFCFPYHGEAAGAITVLYIITHKYTVLQRQVSHQSSFLYLQHLNSLYSHRVKMKLLSILLRIRWHCTAFRHSTMVVSTLGTKWVNRMQTLSLGAPAEKEPCEQRTHV